MMSDLDVGPIDDLAVEIIAGPPLTGRADDVPPEDQGKSPDEIPGRPAGDASAEFGPKERRLGILLAMAMFVLVVDTSLMNVSISAVVRDLDTTVSGVQSAIALEALVSAAFILIGSRVGDFIGRRKAYVIGLVAYGVGATAMTLSQSLTAVIIFWAIIGGLGASMLLPAMQSLIHGNFSGTAQTKVYALVGAAAAIAAAVGPLLGGFITTFLSWRVGFALEAVIIVVVLVNIRLVRDAVYTGPRVFDVGGAVLSVVGMGGVVLGILVWQEGGAYVGVLVAVGLAALVALGNWLVRRRRSGHPTLINPDLFASKPFRLGVSSQMMQQIVLGGLHDRPADLPPDGVRVQRDAGRALDGAALVEHVRDRSAGREAGRPTAAECDHRRRLRADHDRDDRAAADRPSGRLGLVPGRAAGVGRQRTGTPRLAAQQLHVVADLGGERQRGRRSQLGRRVVRSVLRTRLRRSDHAGDDLAARPPPWHTTARCSPRPTRIGWRRPSSRMLR